MSLWRIDDDSADAVVIIDAESAGAAVREYLDGLSQNFRTQPADAADVANYGIWGED